MMETKVNCATDCVNGCILGDKCPNQEYVAETANFIENTSLDTMLEMAEAARLKKMMEPPQWVIPDDL